LARRTPKKQPTSAVTPTKATTLNAWLATIKKNAIAAADAGEEAGACLVNDPHTGTNHCILTDQRTCKSLKGVFLGGPCGG
jgi:hypothetical protein